VGSAGVDVIWGCPVRQSWLSSDGSGSSQADASSEFRLEVEPDRDAVRVCPVGEIDFSTVGGVRAQLDELRSAGFSCLILDLRRATFLDSSGVRLALDAHASAVADGTEFAIVPGPPAVQHTFEVAGVCDRLQFIGSRGQRDGTVWS
jgi:anti-sigma B factor antagonist